MKNQLKVILPLIVLVLVGYFLGLNNQLIQEVVKFSPFALIASSKDTVSVGQLKEMLKTKNGSGAFVLINVHTPYEGEIERTDTFVAYDQVIASSDSLPKDKNAPIILYCKSGRMSGEAIETMKKLGYTNVRHLSGGMDAWQKSGNKLADLSGIGAEVLPEKGFETTVSWGDIGPRLVSLGVIDLAKFKNAVKLTPDQEEILTKDSDQKIKIDAQNSQFVVDLLWAFGLAQKSTVYDKGPMGTQYKNDAGNFASTGGWTLAQGDAVNYLNKYDFLNLTDAQQEKVAEIAKNVYRPCCGNSTWFPDCNHGMAALALIELMVAKGMDDKTIYRNILGFNSFWFPDNYLYIATYFARQGTSWDKVDAKTVLGQQYSSAQGAAAIAKQVGTLPIKREDRGGACGA